MRVVVPLQVNNRSRVEYLVMIDLERNAAVGMMDVYWRFSEDVCVGSGAVVDGDRDKVMCLVRVGTGRSAAVGR